MNYVIITDTSADLPREISERYEIEAVPLSYTVDGVEYVTKPGDDEEMKRFYDLMRERKHEISTSMANGEEFAPKFESILKEGKDILYIGFSSGLSGTVESVSQTLNKLSEKYPERKIYSVDTLAASAGEGLIVLLTILLLGIRDDLIEGDVVFSLCVGNVAQVGIEQVIVIDAYLQHLTHTSRIRRQMAVGSYKKGVFTIFGLLKQKKISFMNTVVVLRHLDAVINVGIRNEYSRRTHLVAGCQGKD